MEKFSIDVESLNPSDEISLGCNLPTARLLLILSHIANMIQSMLFWFRVPTCCNGPNLYPHLAVLPAVGIGISALNLIHLKFIAWPELNNSHYYLCGCYEAICFANMVVLTFSLGIVNLPSLLLTLFGSVYSLCSTVIPLEDVELSDECCSTWFKWNFRLFMVIQLVQIILVIVALTSVTGMVYYLDSDHATYQVWARNVNNELSQFNDCTMSYNLTNSYASANGGIVNEYCAFTFNQTTNSATGGCCSWDNSP